MNFLVGVPPEQWSNAYFESKRYGELCSNVAESFNGWILEERSIPILPMLDRIRSRVMKMILDRRDDSLKWTSTLCPTMEGVLALRIEETRTLLVMKSSEFIYEVESDKKHDVNLLERECSYRQWQINGFPCKHVVVVIAAKGDAV
ncbi:hypothetical protein AQUCO_03200029v1 [Aquilegia coerulea]|uniref:SWIM-type domain-containing protein n=1 Tax=Aquilegia coerulea TaxID=218851 RepID=A0A2G5CZT1_AQUCA|nr:hypothetical protein AQUCO_03200029v1 [Aquilegia coerulea]